MKIREGFVSNSSSCSFIIRKEYVDELKEFRDFLDEQIDDWEEYLCHTDDFEESIEDHGMNNFLLIEALGWIVRDKDNLGRNS